MSILSRLLRRAPPAPAEGPVSAGEDPLVPVPIPPLVVLLADHERRKGASLSEQEVRDLAAGAVCMAMPLSGARKMAEARGYDDIDPDHAWEQWQALNGR
jgi:hypothetical protein